MHSKFLYPVDTYSFVEIREQGKLYVDKTDFIYDIVNVKMYKYVFMARPRRFGKSLLCNTLHAYFEGRKELFKGLKIDALEKDWKKYPVLHFTMSGLKNISVSEARSKLELFISDYEKIYGRNPNASTPGARFRSLLHDAKEQTGMPVVVILDEYDTPLMKMMYHKDRDAMRTMLQEFYQVLKDEGEYLKFVFITGVTKFSQLSIFSELNNLKQLSMFDEYSGLCGITQEELDTVLRPCVEEFAEANECSVDEAYSMLKRHYDGYHFSKNSQDIYAPFSLLNALNDKELGEYWFETGTSKSLIDHLRHFPECDPMEFDGIKVSLGLFNSPCEDAETPIPLLYQSGYLSIDTYDKKLDTYTLHFPNYEVRQGMVGSMTNYLLGSRQIDSDATILKMAEALYDGRLSDALVALRAYIASIPYDIITKKEWMAKKSYESFYKLLLYVIFSLLNSKVETEVKSLLGRADVVIKTDDHVYVIELKVNQSVDVALQQIEDKGYDVKYSADGRSVIKCGVSISSDARNIIHWKSLDEQGNIIDEHKF